MVSELTGPLNLIKGYAELMQSPNFGDSSLSASTLDDATLNIISEADKMLRDVERILAIGAGRSIGE